MTTRTAKNKSARAAKLSARSAEAKTGKQQAPPRAAGSTGFATEKKGVKRRLGFGDYVFAGVHHKSGRLATIREVLASDILTRIGRDLSLHERVRLATRRIRENKDFVPMMMLGISGLIDKRRALKEIKDLSPVGMHLLDIDMRHSRLQIEQSLRTRARKRGRNGNRNDGRN